MFLFWFYFEIEILQTIISSNRNFKKNKQKLKTNANNYFLKVSLLWFTAGSAIFSKHNVKSHFFYPFDNRILFCLIYCTEWCEYFEKLLELLFLFLSLFFRFLAFHDNDWIHHFKEKLFYGL